MQVTASTFTLASADEARDLTDRIKRAGHEFEQLVWEAHERKAWKALDYGTWNDYVRAEFRLGKSHSYRLISFTEVKATLAESPIGDIQPEHESQTRPLASLPAAEQPAAWSAAVERAGGEQPTARVVEEVVSGWPAHVCPRCGVE